jgi:hypothetical protein
MSLRRLSLLLAPTCAFWLLGCAGSEAPSGEVNPPEVARDPNEGTAVITGDEVRPGPISGAPDSVVPATSVLVTADSRFHTGVGVTVVPQNLAGRDIEILIPQGLDYERRTGTPVPGGLRFDNVPEGEFYVRANRLYYLTTERRFDLGVNRVGRPDAVTSSFFETQSWVSFSQLAPWQNYESLNAQGTSLQLISGDVDLAASIYPAIEPTAGDTSLDSPDALVQTFNGYALPVLDAAKGDRVYLNQLNGVPSGTMPTSGLPLTYSTVVAGLHLPSFSFTPDGVSSLPVAATLQPVPTRSFSMEWRLPEFTRWRTDANPAGALSTSAFQVIPAPHGLQSGWVGYQGELLNMYLPRGEDGVIARRLSLGNPYPSDWGVVGLASYSFRSATPVVVGTRNHYPSGSITVIDRLDHLVAGPIQPRVSPPRELRIDGVDAYASRVVGTTQPLVTWAPPRLGTPRAYSVALIRLMGDFTSVPTTRFYVPGNRTQLRLPPGLLESGATYYLRVMADGSPHFEPWRAPYVSAEKLPTLSADTFSAAFTTP